jgi:hypothetical protein
MVSVDVGRCHPHSEGRLPASPSGGNPRIGFGSGSGSAVAYYRRPTPLGITR